jgi:hypothetical protein
MRINVIHKEISGGTGQTMDYREIFGLVGIDNLQIAIHIDNIQFQSYAKIMKWDGNQWQLVYSRLAENISGEKLTYQNSITHAQIESRIEGMRERLMEIAAKVCKKH